MTRILQDNMAIPLSASSSSYSITSSKKRMGSGRFRSSMGIGDDDGSNGFASGESVPL